MNQDSTGEFDANLACLPRPLLATHPEWVELYDFAWSLAGKSLRQSAKRRYMDIGFGLDMNLEWVWDTCFVALYARYGGDGFPGINGLDNFYDLQRDDGYIGMTYNMDTGEERFPDRINPPLFAWTEWEYYRTTGDDSRLARVAPRIERHMNWIDANRRNEPHFRRAVLRRPTGDGDLASLPSYRLYFFKDCGSSGMDDAPRTPRRIGAGQYFDWIDLSAQMALSFACLARIRDHLGDRDQAEAWRRRAERLGALINSELWCDKTAFYHDRQIPTNFVAHKTVAGFWPILAGICPPERLQALVGHLEDKTAFNRPTPVPSLSADDINYDPDGRYWNGGVWAPTNYMVMRGLMLHGKGDVAHVIARKYIEALAATYRAVDPPTLWECYSPETNRPGIRAHSMQSVRPDFVGWSAIGPTAMLIENILGIDLDMSLRTLTWDIRLTEEHGISNLPLGSKGRIELACAHRDTEQDPAKVMVRSTADIAVVLRRGPLSKTIRATPGQSLTVTC